MRDLLTFNRHMKAKMMDISPYLLERQKETLKAFDADFELADILTIETLSLSSFELAILNENIGDFPALVAEPVEVLEGSDPGPDPFAGARALLGRLDRTAPPPDAPPFAGGLVGHLGYDLGRRLERLPARASDDQGLPDLRLGLHAWAIAWDADGRAQHCLFDLEWLAAEVPGGRMERADVGGAARITIASSGLAAQASGVPTHADTGSGAASPGEKCQ